MIINKWPENSGDFRSKWLNENISMFQCFYHIKLANKWLNKFLQEKNTKTKTKRTFQRRVNLENIGKYIDLKINHKETKLWLNVEKLFQLNNANQI